MKWGLVQKPTGFPIVVLCFFLFSFSVPEGYMVHISNSLGMREYKR